MEQQQIKISAVEEKYLEQFTEMLVKQLETFKGDWKKTWQTEGCFGAAVCNQGREYRGCNAFLLMMVCAFAGYKYPVFGTYNSWQEFSFKTVTKKGKKPEKVRLTDEQGNELPIIHVKSEEHGYPALFTFYKVFKKDGSKSDVDFDDYCNMNEKEQDEYVTVPRMVMHRVFNIDQTNMAEVMPELYKKLTKTEKKQRVVLEGDVYKFRECDDMLSTQGWVCPIKPTYGDNAYYSISKDEIVVPQKEQFVNGESFYSTLFHEMAHSTGAESRLNRLKPAGFGSTEYATEELVAEMSAALLCSRYGIQNGVKEDSLAYLDNWLSNLKKGPAYIKTVMADVRKASDMIIEKIETVD